MVVPVHYEQELIAETLEALERALRHPFVVLLVYDQEDDPTLTVVRSGAARWPHAELLRNAYGRGVLGAIKTGLAESRGEYAVVFMADLSDDPDVINRMVDRADQGFDVVSASRYMKGGSKLGGPRLKTFLSRGAGLSLHALTRIPTHDATNAFRLYRRTFLETVQIESRGGFEVTMELTIKAYLARRPVAEVPATWTDRTAGTSKFRMRRWLPHYLRWYFYALARSPLGVRIGG